MTDDLTATQVLHGLDPVTQTTRMFAASEEGAVNSVSSWRRTLLSCEAADVLLAPPSTERGLFVFFLQQSLILCGQTAEMCRRTHAEGLHESR